MNTVTFIEKYCVYGKDKTPIKLSNAQKKLIEFFEKCKAENDLSRKRNIRPNKRIIYY